MPGVSVAERTKLSWLLVRRGYRSVAGHIHAHPLLRWRLVSGKADRLEAVPQDLRTADVTRASEIYAGRFAFAGKVVICDRRSPFEMTPPSEEWAVQLLGFAWLRDLHSAESGITRANARALIDEWIAMQGSWNALAWRPDVLARRITSWLSHAALVVDDSDLQFYRNFMRSLTRQVRYLRRIAGEAREGAQRLEVLIALAVAALSMAGQTRHLRGAVKKLNAELDRQILPDGGHVSRNPSALIELLLDLLPLRGLFSARDMVPPPALLNALDRMMPMLRFFRHGDGNFALFNGMGPTAPEEVATALSYDDARGAPVSNAPHSGYQRLVNGSLLLLADTGAPPPIGVSQEAHAGCLSFELSSGADRIVTNCGLPATNREAWRQIARATAAHSTVTFNDTSSCKFLDAGAFRPLIGIPIVAGPTRVSVEREDGDDGAILRASHNGYADRFGIVHQRTLILAPGGDRLEGEDRFLPAQRVLPAAGGDRFAVRFHLHPSVKANRLTDGHGAMLMLPSREVWTFDAHEDEVELEESVFLAGHEGPRRAFQIVIYGRAREISQIRWTFSHVSPSQTPARRTRGEEPELPL